MGRALRLPPRSLDRSLRPGYLGGLQDGTAREGSQALRRGVNGIKEKGKDTIKKLRKGESLLGQLAQPGEQESRAPLRRCGWLSLLTQACGGVPPGAGNADPQKFAAGVPGGAERGD